MNKKRFFTTLTILAFVSALSLGLGGTSGTVRAAKKVTKVTSKTSYKNNKTIIKLFGKTKDGKTVWTYSAPKTEATELTPVSYKVKKDKVYVFFSGEKSRKFTILKKQSGKILFERTSDDGVGGSATIAVDDSGNTYAQGFYDNRIYKFSPEAELIWKSEDLYDKYGIYWPYKMKIKGNTLTVWYDCGDGDEPIKKCKFSTLSGKKK